ncbi:MAG: acyltransferase [Flavobacteriales bacterium]|nr:acyltransferase [Flavobacteriales bacterium]
MLTPATRFPNLDGLRFIAASLVIVHHAENCKALLGLPYTAHLEQWDQLGHLGVLLFFVISGFLITYLLLKEEQANGRYSIRHFQMRRILRIWPLYFLMVLLALFVLPFIGLLHLPDTHAVEVLSNWPGKLGLFMAFLPSWVTAMAGPVPDAMHLWSIGTEEHFYIVWPFLLLLFKRFRPALMIAVFLGYAMVYRLLAPGFEAHGTVQWYLFKYWLNFNIDTMAVGAFMALLFLRQSPLLKLLVDTRIFIAVLLITVVTMAIDPKELVGYRVYSLLFGLLVINLAVNPRLARVLEYPALRYLGRISYGIYVYHIAITMLVLQLFMQWQLPTGLLPYPFIFLLSIAVSWASHRYFESWFLRKRSRFRPHPAVRAAS